MPSRTVVLATLMLLVMSSVALVGQGLADWTRFEDALEHLAAGDANDAARVFEAIDEPPLAAVSAIASRLTKAYSRLEPKKERKAKARLFALANDAAVVGSVMPEDFDKAIRRARAHLDDDPAVRPQIRMLLCHLKLLSGVKPKDDEVHEMAEQGWTPTPVLSFYPEYTDLARKRCVQGTVFTRAIIDADGCTTGVSVVKGLPFGLTEATVRTQLWAVYHPVEVAGEATPFYADLTTNFRVSCGERDSC